MTINKIRRNIVISGGIFGMLGHFSARADDRKSLKIILPISAGSGVDTIVRTASPALGNAFGHPVVVENLAGAGGITGAAAIAKAAPDGNTIGFISNNHVINPAIYKKMPFDAVEDFTPITVLGASPLVLLVNPKVRAKNAQELISLLKSAPEKYNYGSSGNGTVLHLAAEMFLDQGDVKARHIPYKGTGPMINDMISGQVQFGVLGMSAALPHIRNGALQAIGICGSSRSAVDPNIPTIAEQGLPEYNIEGWYAVIGPKKMPSSEVQRIHQNVVKAFSMPGVLESMKKLGTEIKPTSAEAAQAFFRTEAERYARLARKAGATLD